MTSHWILSHEPLLPLVPPVPQSQVSATYLQKGFLFPGSSLFLAPSWAHSLASPSPPLRHIHISSTATGWPQLPWVFRLEFEPASLFLLFYPGTHLTSVLSPQSLSCFVPVGLNSAVPPTHHFFALCFLSLERNLLVKYLFLFLGILLSQQHAPPWIDLWRGEQCFLDKGMRDVSLLFSWYLSRAESHFAQDACLPALQLT